MLMSRLFLFVLPVALLLPCVASAQMFSYEPSSSRSLTTLTVGYTPLAFTYAGSGNPDPRLDFEGPIYSLRFGQANFDFSLAYGQQSADDAAVPGQSELKLLDVAVFGGVGIPVVRRPNVRLFIPIVIHTGYRVVGQDLRDGLTNELFNFTVFGIGTGLGAGGSLADERVQFDVRATPAVGLALRSFEGLAGNANMFRARAQVNIRELFGNLGLSMGYQYRGQAWNIDGSDLAPNLTDDVFDYKSIGHTILVGVNW